MNQDQWKGRIGVAIGAVKELTGSLLHDADLKERGRRERKVGNARAGYGSAVAAVVRRSH